ncbi:MAG: hypothetical protein L6R39_007065, partial [Caloplaca ligustica]
KVARGGQGRFEDLSASNSTSRPNARDAVDVKNETNKDGSGKGQMAAWKGMKIAKEYEKKGGGYENEPGTENKPNKGPPESKSDEQKKEEKGETKEGSDDKQDEKEKPKANSGKKATGKKGESKAKAPKKAKKTPTEGTRKSSRVAGKRSAPEDEQKTEEKAPAKKAKTNAFERTFASGRVKVSYDSQVPLTSSLRLLSSAQRGPYLYKHIALTEAAKRVKVVFNCMFMWA